MLNLLLPYSRDPAMRQSSGASLDDARNRAEDCGIFRPDARLTKRLALLTEAHATIRKLTSGEKP